MFFLKCVEKEDKNMDKDLQVIFRYLFPELQRYIWAILASLAITGLMIGADLLQPYFFKLLVDGATVEKNIRLSLLSLFCFLSLLSYDRE